MSRDYGELERQFIDGLAADTGRSLGQWMALIDAQSFAHRNDMIDWLRQQKLTFAKASRLERIHHNGGKPLYGDKPMAKVVAESAATVAALIPKPEPSLPQPAVIVVSPPPQPAPAAAPTTDLGPFLAKAKGYRPLAELLIRNLLAAVPGTTIAVHDTHIDLAAPATYAALAVTQKDVRLALALGDHPFDGDFKRLRLPGVGPTLTHTLVINDARRIDAGLMALAAEAANLVNAKLVNS